MRIMRIIYHSTNDPTTFNALMLRALDNKREHALTYTRTRYTRDQRGVTIELHMYAFTLICGV